MRLGAVYFSWLKRTWGEKAALRIERAGARWDRFVRDEKRLIAERRAMTDRIRNRGGLGSEKTVEASKGDESSC